MAARVLSALVFGVVCLAGCSVLPPQPLTHSTGFAPVYPVVAAAPEQATGSLYNAGVGETFLGRGRNFQVGDVITVGVFAEGDTVKVTGTSKGRGFQGVVKRWNFGGGPNTHGNTKHRRPGSIGAGTDPSRVIKGKKMPGHYGAERVTQTHLRVEKIDAERNLIYIRGSVAGPKNGIVLVRKQG